MTKNGKLKVVWICHFSDKKINESLPLKVNRLFAFLYRLYRGKDASTKVPDFAIWNINALKEMVKYSDKIELHVIAPYSHLDSKIYEYKSDGIYYHFFRPSSILLECLANRFPLIYDLYKPKYKGNRRVIRSIIKQINPSIAHIIGAENPYYSISGLDIDEDIKLIVQLQTLMSDPKFFTNYPIDRRLYDYRSEIERIVIKRADYVGTTIDEYRKIILEHIDPDANFLNLKLAIAETVRNVRVNKEYDFVYFSRAISKAGDWAISSFIEASKIKPGITLLVIGGYAPEEKEGYEKTLAEHGLVDKVTFTGELPTHEDVLNFVAKARVAVLPLKIDYISGTIREANALGLPVVTSITVGTPKLNIKRQCALLSTGGDHTAMAANMIKVLEDPVLARELIQNSYIMLNEAYDNSRAIAGWVEAYEKIARI